MSDMMTQIIAVATGGALGASLRYGVMVAMGRLFGVLFPWGTIAVNIIGSLGLGFVISWFAVKYTPPDWLRLFLVVGLAGGFTTFSTFALDLVTLWERKQALTSGAYLIGSVVLSLIALMVGMWLGRSSV